MGAEWKTELDVLVAETMAFAKAIDLEVHQPRSQPKEEVERVGLKPLELGGPEREEIRKRIDSFRRHQQRFIREREEYAASILMRMRRPVAKPERP